MGEPKYNRRAFSLVDTLKMLIHQGVEVRCYRSGVRFTLENVGRAQKEHLHELALAKTHAEKRALDVPDNCRVSLSEAHAVITNGTKATSAGSSKHRVAKAVRMEKARLAEPPSLKAHRAGVEALREAGWTVGPTIGGPSKMQSRGFDKTLSKKFNGKTVKRKVRRSK